MSGLEFRALGFRARNSRPCRRRGPHFLHRDRHKEVSLQGSEAPGFGFFLFLSASFPTRRVRDPLQEGEHSHIRPCRVWGLVSRV